MIWSKSIKIQKSIIWLKFISLSVGISMSLGSHVAFGAQAQTKATCLDLVSSYSFELALQQCENELERGSLVANEILGYIYLKGKSGYRDVDLARRYFEQARKEGIKHASGFLGMIYWQGLGVEVNKEKARGYFMECLDLSQENKAQNCAVLYAKTLSAEGNPPQIKAEGILWYGKLIEAGEYVYLYNFAEQAAQLGRWADAYASAEFFKMWAKRYGELWLLRLKYQQAEKISAQALGKLKPRQVEALSLDIKKRLNVLREQIKTQPDLKLDTELQRAIYFLQQQD